MKKKIGEILIAHGVISAKDMGEALALQADGDPGRLGEILVRQGRLEADALARALAEQNALPYTDLSLVSSSFARVLPLSFQHRHGLVPFEEPSPGEFCIAVADPMDTDAIDRAGHWLNAKSIQLYVASADEIGRVLSAMGDQALASGEILAVPEEGAVVSEEVSAAPEEGAVVSEEVPASSEEALVAPEEDSEASSALSEEDLFGSLGFEEAPAGEKGEGEAPAAEAEGEAEGGEAQPLLAAEGADELTQIVRRPGPPSDADTQVVKPRAQSLASDAFREQTPAAALGEATLPGLTFGQQLTGLLAGKEAEALADIVVGLADLLVKKSVLSREEVLDIFASSPVEKW